MERKVNKHDATLTALVQTLGDHLSRRLPARRLATLSGLLLHAGLPPERFREGTLADRLLFEQRQDGGWVDVEDTAWCSFVLGRLGYKDSEYAGKDWIRSERNLGAWGYCRRDTPCIPITALVSWLHPDMADSEAFDWLSETWREDLRSSYKLSYKGAWYLLARSSDAERDISLCAETVSWLVSDQRWEGGWGPWNSHPAATDAFSTGIAMSALSLWARRTLYSDSVLQALGLAREWLERNRLENGLFPFHYIEQASAWLALGEASAILALANLPNGVWGQ